LQIQTEDLEPISHVIRFQIVAPLLPLVRIKRYLRVVVKGFMNRKIGLPSALFLILLLLFSDGLADTPGSNVTTWVHVQSGVASWYGAEEQGKLTANGEIFDRHKFTAASRKLPFNTIVRVINRENGRFVEVRINDRGPYKQGRILDLSEAAAKTLKIGKVGLAHVDIQVKRPATEVAGQ